MTRHEPPHWRDDTDWQRLSDVVARLKARVEDAIAARDDFEGGLAHADLLDAEHRLRMAERRRARG